ncbi:chromosome transmission fidelity factor [Pelomyxa schiedti]|nr:chromosome transmission fidelity factor [Pelomyxa schiedti]
MSGEYEDDREGMQALLEMEDEAATSGAQGAGPRRRLLFQPTDADSYSMSSCPFLPSLDTTNDFQTEPSLAPAPAPDSVDSVREGRTKEQLTKLLDDCRKRPPKRVHKPAGGPKRVRLNSGASSFPLPHNPPPIDDFSEGSLRITQRMPSDVLLNASLNANPLEHSFTATSMSGCRVVIQLAPDFRLLERPPTLCHDEELKSCLLPKNATELLYTMSKSTVPTNNVDPLLPVENDLWVDKYAPKTFIDLLSDERINREVLSWLKKWDSVVFPAKTEVQNHDKLPDHRAIVLCGPPGSGKTTLAHVVARQAGYNPIEVNASMVRTAEDFKKAVSGVIDHKAVFKTSTTEEIKPNLLILDEIDGMHASDGQGAIDYLCKLLAISANKIQHTDQEQPEDMEEAEPPGKKEKGWKNPYKPKKLVKKPSSVSVLERKPSSRARPTATVTMRPIICTCNDLYVPVLRKLRPLVSIFNISKPKVTRLCDRLNTICRLESTPIEYKHLMALCNRSELDVRECLNVLQFLKGRHATISRSDFLNEMQIGAKDSTRSLFDVWSMIFRNWKAGKETYPSKDSFNEHLLKHVESLPWDKVQDGCWQNYINAVSADDSLFYKIESCSDWMCFCDIMSSKALMYQSQELRAYLPISALALNTICNITPQINIEYPSMSFKLWSLKNQNLNVLTSFMNNMCNPLRLSLSQYNIIAELLPYLLTILSTPIRTVNKNLTSPQEQAMINRIIELYFRLGLKFRRTTSEKSSVPVYELDPPLESLIQGLAQLNRHTMPNTHREFINNEVWQLAVRERHKNDPPSEPLPATPTKKVAPPKTAVPLKPKKDFWGRVIVDDNKPTKATSPPKNAPPGSPEHQNSIVRYKYHEGTTCGVRRKVLFSEFLL